MFTHFINKFFKLNPDRYYVEVVRIWNHTSWNSDTKCFTASHPVFVIKKRNYFKRDEIVNSLWYTNRIEDALNKVRELNGHDYTPNEKAYTDETLETYVSFDTENNDSGFYVRTKN